MKNFSRLFLGILAGILLAAGGFAVAQSYYGYDAETGVYGERGPVQLKNYTVATLPTCGSGDDGEMAWVTDATSPTYNGALTGGGAVGVAVGCNGTAWTSQ